MGTQFRYRYIGAESSCVANVGELALGGEYDIVIAAANWDSRSTWITGIDDLAGRLGIMIMYDQQDPAGRQSANEEQLSAYLGGACRDVVEIRECSRNISELWNRLYAAICQLGLRSPNHLRICFDITSIPRFCFLAALSGCLQNGLAESITFLYAEGDYGDPGEGAEYAFHEGEWRCIPIAHLERPDDPAKRKYILVSVGFEGTRTMRVTSGEEPDRISILFPKPGVRPDYVRLARKANRELLQEFLVPAEQIVHARAGDAVQAWKRLHEASLERPETENIYYLSSGTKPPALGLGLRALETGYGTALYYVPDGHSVTNVKPAGVYWRYDIRDLSAIPLTRTHTSAPRHPRRILQRWPFRKR